jgi:hypothetical protein
MITLSLSGLPSLTLYQIPDNADDDDFVTRSRVDVIRAGSPTNQGVDTLEGSGKPYFFWSFQVVVSDDEVVLFDEMSNQQQGLYQNRQDGKITLLDERFWVSNAESTKNLRTRSGGTATTWGGIKYRISCPVLLRVPENHSSQLADDMWVLQFDAKELTA